MKRTLYLKLFTIIFMAALMIAYVFLKEHNIEYKLVGKAYTGDSMFNIGRCTLWESETEFNSDISWCHDHIMNPAPVEYFEDSIRWVETNIAIKEEYKYFSQLKEKKLLDFKGYNYLICHGCEIKRMYRSLFNTYFRDETSFTPAKRYGKDLLCIEYANGKTTFDFDLHAPFSYDGDRYIYVYRINKEENVQPMGE